MNMNKNKCIVITKMIAINLLNYIFIIIFDKLAYKAKNQGLVKLSAT